MSLAAAPLPVDSSTLAVPARLADAAGLYVADGRRVPAAGNVRLTPEGGSVVVSSHRVRADDALLVVLFITNSSPDTPVTDVPLVVSEPRWLECATRTLADPAAHVVGGHVAALGPLAPLATACAVVVLTLAGHPTPQELGALATCVTGTAHGVPFAVPLTVADIVRPAPASYSAAALQAMYRALPEWVPGRVIVNWASDAVVGRGNAPPAAACGTLAAMAARLPPELGLRIISETGASRRAAATCAALIHSEPWARPSHCASSALRGSLRGPRTE